MQLLDFLPHCAWPELVVYRAGETLAMRWEGFWRSKVPMHNYCELCHIFKEQDCENLMIKKSRTILPFCIQEICNHPISNFKTSDLKTYIAFKRLIYIGPTFVGSSLLKPLYFTICNLDTILKICTGGFIREKLA